MHDGPHHPEGPVECFGCRIRTIQISPSAMPSRRNKVAPRGSDNAWERGEVVDSRGGGHVMPLLDKNLQPITTKDYADNRRRFEAERRKLANSPYPIAP